MENHVDSVEEVGGHQYPPRSNSQVEEGENIVNVALLLIDNASPQ
jgi:hypothetical protein